MMIPLSILEGMDEQVARFTMLMNSGGPNIEERACSIHEGGRITELCVATVYGVMTILLSEYALRSPRRSTPLIKYLEVWMSKETGSLGLTLVMRNFSSSPPFCEFHYLRISLTLQERQADEGDILLSSHHLLDSPWSS